MIDWKKLKKLSNENIKNENPYNGLEIFQKKETYSQYKPLITVNNLSHSFGNKKIYDNINFEIFENERLAFLGPNGSGKTLTISTLAGFIKPKDGEIKYMFDYEKTPYEKISVQFQDLRFPSSLTPKDLIEFTIKLTNSGDMENEIIEGIKTFEIDKIMNTKISKLSGGQQQRINVFISMIGKPKILFLDEFTTGLDISIKDKLKDYILNFCDKYKITLVIISHDIDCIEDMADRIIILADKKIMIDAKVEDIITKFGSVKTMLKKYIVM
ncbi:MAG: ABC transporter ATP-binding protein [Mycoplasma sp.]|nr:ABC transporter ATP-binding protein [Mycoplasma sp.]